MQHAEPSLQSIYPCKSCCQYGLFNPSLLISWHCLCPHEWFHQDERMLCSDTNPLTVVLPIRDTPSQVGCCLSAWEFAQAKKVQLDAGMKLKQIEWEMACMEKEVFPWGLFQAIRRFHVDWIWQGNYYQFLAGILRKLNAMFQGGLYRLYYRSRDSPQMIGHWANTERSTYDLVKSLGIHSMKPSTCIPLIMAPLSVSGYRRHDAQFKMISAQNLWDVG